MSWPVELSPSEPEPLFFDQAGHISPSATELAGPDPIPEDAAIFSVLQFGAIVPPLSPWRGVERLKPGYRYDSPETGRPVPVEPLPDVETLGPEGQADTIERVLDSVLVRVLGDGPHPVVLFSGGVDSALIACRLQQLGYDGAILLNYSYRDGDPESDFAEEMAGHLGLRFEKVVADLTDPCACLHEPGQSWPQPFSDPTTVEVWDLARTIVDRFEGTGRPVLDGTGSYVNRKIEEWERLLGTPSSVRRLMASGYRIGNLRRPGRLDRALRTARRSVTMPPLSAALGQNALAGLLYEDSLADGVHALLADWLGSWAGDTLPRRIVAGIYALLSAIGLGAKLPPLLEPAGIDVHYPYIETECVAMALSTAGVWKSREEKAPLKHALARHVPADLVYRRKSGFIDPAMRVFFEPTFTEYLRASIEPSGPIASMLEPAKVVDACNALELGQRPPEPVLRCLWAIVFLDRWYRSARS